MNEEEKKYRLEHPFSSTPTHELAEYFRDWQRGPSGRMFCHQSASIEPILMEFMEYCRWRIKGVDSPIHLPPAYKGGGGWPTAHIIIPEDLDTSWEATHQFIRSIHSLKEQRFSCEVVGTSDEISIQFACPDSDALNLLCSHLESVYPTLAIQHDLPDRLIYWTALEDDYRQVVEFGLHNAFVLPLYILSKSKLDPWTGIISALSRLKEDETGIVQIIFRPAVQNWRGELETIAGFLPLLLSDTESGQEHVGDLIQEKISNPLFLARLRIAAKAKTTQRVGAILNNLKAPLAILQRQRSNSLIELDTNALYRTKRLADPPEQLYLRHSWVTGMLLNSEELASLLHLPPPAARTDKLVQPEPEARTKAAPESVIGGTLRTNDQEENAGIVQKAVSRGILLGINSHQGEHHLIAVSNEHRLKHTHIIGASGTGKSTLLLSLICQDMNRGEGLAVLDPHGDLVEDVLARIPEHRLQDVVLFDPTDEEHPVGFNILAANTPAERNLIASDLVGMFQRLNTSWGDQMTTVLSNAILAILESKEGGTLVDLRRFLLEKDFRESFLTTVQDLEVVYFWKKQFPQLTGAKSVGPITTRLDAFLRQKVLRCIVGQKKPKVDYGQMMNGRKIFLAKLASGIIGEENSYLLGTLLVSKFQQLALARQSIPEPQRADFFLYIDEFHNFITPSMGGILTGARKYHLGLILAHQESQQLRKENSTVGGSVLANPSTRICFRLGDDDADKFEDHFSFFESDDLKNLGRGEAICRIEKASNDFNLSVIPAPTPEQEEAESVRDQARAISFGKYAGNKAEIEAEIYKDLIGDESKPGARGRKIEINETGADEETVRSLSYSGEYHGPPEPSPVDYDVMFHEAGAPSVVAPLAAETQATNSDVPKPSTIKPISKPPVPKEVKRDIPTHTKIKTFLALWCGKQNYLVNAEMEVDGGRIDLVLSKEGLDTIACEISVTNEPEYEYKNLLKCLRAKIPIVCLLSEEQRKLDKVKKLVDSRLSEGDRARIKFFMIDKFKEFIDERSAQAPPVSEETVRGHPSKLIVGKLPSKDQQLRSERIQRILYGPKRKKDDDKKDPDKA